MKMLKLIFGSLLLCFLTIQPASAITSDETYILNKRFGKAAMDISLGDLMSDITEAQLRSQVLHEGLHAKRMARTIYDFSVDGGAIGSINLGAIIPAKAIINQCVINVITAMASVSGAGTVAISAESAGDIKAAVDADTLSGIVAGIPIGTAATMIKTTVARQLTLAIAGSPLTAGKIAVLCDYDVSE
jgi:hypothetical protein